MTKGKTCKTKGCNNPVIEGKYCEQCTQTRKETKDKVLAGVGTGAVVGVGVAAKTGVLKQIPVVAVKLIKGILKL
jgi:hypothetical protein